MCPVTPVHRERQEGARLPQLVALGVVVIQAHPLARPHRRQLPRAVAARPDLRCNGEWLCEEAHKLTSAAARTASPPWWQPPRPRRRRTLSSPAWTCCLPSSSPLAVFAPSPLNPPPPSRPSSEAPSSASITTPPRR